jgi:hypothetical protein
MWKFSVASYIQTGAQILLFAEHGVLMNSETISHLESTPIWMAVLMASRCLANRDGKGSAVRWNQVSGKALYTNSGDDTELILPLGVFLRGGQTLMVSWLPGDTAYTVEVA